MKRDLESAKLKMLERLRESGVKDERVLRAMFEVPREEFVDPRLRNLAYADRALPIEEGQTISQPAMVGILVDALQLRAGDKVLDVGTGSGYQAAVIAQIGAHVIGIERVEKLAHAARERFARLGYNIKVVTGDGSEGLEDEAPFDAIAVGAAAPRLPLELAQQLTEGGRLVVPVAHGEEGEELTRLRVTNGDWHTENLGLCRFVPLIGRNAYRES